MGIVRINRQVAVVLKDAVVVVLVDGVVVVRNWLSSWSPSS